MAGWNRQKVLLLSRHKFVTGIRRGWILQCKEC